MSSGEKAFRISVILMTIILIAYAIFTFAVGHIVIHSPDKEVSHISTEGELYKGVK